MKDQDSRLYKINMYQISFTINGVRIHTKIKKKPEIGQIEICKLHDPMNHKIYVLIQSQESDRTFTGKLMSL